MMDADVASAILALTAALRGLERTMASQHAEMLAMRSFNRDLLALFRDQSDLVGALRMEVRHIRTERERAERLADLAATATGEKP